MVITLKPIIGMTAMPFENGEMKVYRCNQSYVQAILDAGGIPVLLPSNGANEDYAELAAHLDGLLIPGGGDISTFLYGEEAIKQVTNMRSADDLFEFAVLRRMAE